MIILLVEDEKETRECLAEFLKDHGHLVLECSDARTALEILNARDVELVVSDIRMSGMSGLELLQEVRGSRDTPFIFVTAYSEYLDEMQLMPRLSFQYLLKPLDLDLFADLVQKIAVSLPPRNN